MTTRGARLSGIASWGWRWGGCCGGGCGGGGGCDQLGGGGGGGPSRSKMCASRSVLNYDEKL